ncbi:MAG: hypothetical protein FWE35_14235 [Streptosporangiales bacterium]|nr:hypothetical protein [Streptosporangiales bacterium]
MTSGPRSRTSHPASGTQAAEAPTVRIRAAASACVAVVIAVSSATGCRSSRMPGGWTNAKS